ncbi:MAG: N-acetylneuraminate synthase family protein [Deltaproteobacteria bacterium]|nr:N-acetylneuraminate synthase family protein [Deltaproteobacteria bacterium]
MNRKVMFIAEVGSNYNADIEVAKKYIYAARDSGANAVKFQTLRRDKLVAPKILLNGTWTDNPVYHSFNNLELQDDWHYILKATADELGIEFISTPFYLEAVDLLEKVGVCTCKIASGDITFFPLLEAVGHTGQRVILSTGASSLPDVERAVNILTRSGAGEISLLHCVTNYPPRWDEMNLRAIVTLKETFDLPVGISDHSPGNMVPIAAVALGATVIEKHITFDRSLPGPDHPFSVTMAEFSDMVRQVRLLEQTLGTGEKVPTEAELAKQHRIRRGIYDPVTYEPSDDPKGIWLRPEHKPS